jgi:uncharacterized protein YndB with AHSA1/START domain
MADKFSTSLSINSTPARVWHMLTNPELMKKWMGEPEMEIEVHTDWKVNSSILISAFLHVKSVSKGTVLKYDREKILSYSQLSSISHLVDIPENYTILEFALVPVDKQTQLTVTVVNFPTDTIRKHLEFYWRTTIMTIKAEAERQIDQR